MAKLAGPARDEGRMERAFDSRGCKHVDKTCYSKPFCSGTRGTRTAKRTWPATASQFTVQPINPSHYKARFPNVGHGHDHQTITRRQRGVRGVDLEAESKTDLEKDTKRNGSMDRFKVCLGKSVLSFSSSSK